jgi:hypothetical protein
MLPLQYLLFTDIITKWFSKYCVNNCFVNESVNFLLVS